MRVRIIHSFFVCVLALLFYGACVYEDIGWLFPLDQWQSVFFWFYFIWVGLMMIPYWVIEAMSDSSLTADLVILGPPVALFAWMMYQ